MDVDLPKPWGNYNEVEPRLQQDPWLDSVAKCCTSGSIDSMSPPLLEDCI